MSRPRCFVRSLVVVVALLWAQATVVAAAPTPTVRAVPTPGETVLDRRVHLEDGVVPLLPLRPLCEALGFEPKWVDLEDGRLFYEVEGAGPTLVLVDGGPGNSHHEFHPWFSRAAQFCRVVYYDQRGCGRSTRTAPAGGFTVDGAVEDLEALRRAVGAERWFVLGWSYGGMLAQCYAVRHPERVAGLVLVASSPVGHGLHCFETRRHQFMSEREVARITELTSNADLAPDVLIFNRMLNGDWKRQHFTRPSRAAMCRMGLYDFAADFDFVDAMCADVTTVDLRGRFVGCPFPVFVVEATWDLTWAEDKAQKFRACSPGASSVTFERAGHGPFMDEPEAFFQALRAFIVTAMVR